MTDFLLEILSEEIPARMQGKAQQDLARLFSEQLSAAGLAADKIETYVTPRRLALIARGLPAETAPVREETKGPRASAPPQALDGFLRKTGLTRDQLEERDGVLFAIVDRSGRATASVLAEAIPAIVRAFPWLKSMRWGEASTSTESPRWVRPLQGVVALLGEEIVDFEIAGIRSGAATVGHRFHHSGVITLGGAGDYVEKLHACHVIVDPAERRRIIADGARAAAAAAGLTLVEDEGLLAENAGLTEWPVPLLGAFDSSFLEVPREVIQLTMRTNQKYFACTHPPRDGEGNQPKAGGGGSEPGTAPPPSALRPDTSPSRGGLAPNFVCTANIEAADGGAAIVQGNERVLSARLADAKFFWEQDLRVPLEKQAEKLREIVFHEKLGTVADKVDRVAKLARWLVEEGIIGSSPERGGGPPAKPVVEGAPHLAQPPLHQPAAGPPPRSGEELADLAETAARLAKADLVSGLVGEFPELQGVIGGHLALCQGHSRAISDAIRDHYKPAGQGDEVPTAPVTVAVSLADKLDTLINFFAEGEQPTGSRDPYGLRRLAIAIIALIVANELRAGLDDLYFQTREEFVEQYRQKKIEELWPDILENHELAKETAAELAATEQGASHISAIWQEMEKANEKPSITVDQARDLASMYIARETQVLYQVNWLLFEQLNRFFADRLKVQQREAGVRHDLIDAVFALGGEDDLVRLLARVKALQAFVETPEGADLLAGYKRAANILKKEGRGTPSPSRGEGQASVASQGEGTDSPSPSAADAAFPSPLQGEGQNKNKSLSYTPEREETALIVALDSAEPSARAAVEAEDFEGAMAALAMLRAPVDAFFDKVTVNDPDEAKREARLTLLARMRDAVHQVADFSRIEG